MTRSKFFSSWVLACVAAIGLSGEMFAQTGYPMLMSIRPIAAQAGATSEHEVDSRYNMYGAYQVLVSGQGVVGEVVTKMDDKNTNKKNLTTLKVRFKVEKDALPGVRDVRVATPQGVSTLGQLVIASDPVFMESKPNNTMPQAEAITLPVTLCGRVEANEDVDFFKFKVEAGKTLQFHCRSNRLQNRIHDLQEHSDIIFSIRNSTGTTVAQVDNYFAADPFLSYRFEQAGEYFLEIRDVRYKGNTYWGYAIEISERPFVQTAHPLAVTAGKSSTIAPIGAMIPPNAQVPVTLPASLRGHQFVRLPLAGSSSNPVQLFATDLPITVESGSENDTVEKAQPITVPGVVAGRIEKTADMDCFSFTAKKGERFTFEVHARRLDSSMDPFLNIRNEKGAILFGNDDMQLHKGSTADSRIEFWAAPADGKYVVEVRDVHLRGGDAFTYAVEITRATPYFELYLDTDKTLLTPGTSAVLFARVVRKNGFKGAVDLAISGLPKGVEASCGQIPEAGTDACIILTAPPAAPLAVSNIQVTGSGVHTDEAGKTTPLNRIAVPLQEIYMPGGGRWHWIVDSHAVSVGAPGDIRSVKLSTYDITLKPGESKKIEVTIERAPGFNSNVTLDLIYQHLGTKFGDTLPKGMSIDGKTSKTLLSSTDSKGTLTITAAADAAPVEKQQLSVMANISLNFVMKATYSASPLRVTVLKK